VNGLVLDASALLQYASGKSIEPGQMLTLADEDPDQQVWVPAACLAQAHLELAGSTSADILELLFAAGRQVNVSPLDGDVAGRVGRIGAQFQLRLDVAHAVDTAVLSRCFIVTAVPDVIAPTRLEMLDIGESWD
jgi:hypothetical protein